METPIMRALNLVLLTAIGLGLVACAAGPGYTHAAGAAGGTAAGAVIGGVADGSGEGALVGANALVAEGKEIPPRSLALGSPARVVRSLSDEEVANIERIAEHYAQKAKLYREHLRAWP